MHKITTTVALLLALGLGGSNVSIAQSTCGPIDFVLVLDDTSSMSGAIANVKEESATLTSALDASSGGDLRTALVTFKDAAEVDVGLTANLAQFRQRLDQVTASGGARTPEASDEALAKVLEFSFRPNSTKIVVLVTDAPPGGTDDLYVPGIDDLRAADLAKIAREAGILISALHVPNPSFLTQTRSIMERYADITGGIFRQLNRDGTGAAKAIQDSIRSCGGGCARQRREKLLCTTDGSGDFTYDFFLINLFEEPVHHVFLLDPTEGVTFHPNHIEFTPPVRKDHAQRVPKPIRITGAEPGQTISFVLSLHDELLEECCSVRVTLTLPECTCGQVPSDRAPGCPFLGGSPEDSRTDRFVFENLFDQAPVEHVLLTVISPEGVELVPNHFDLRDSPLEFGDRREFPVRIVGGKAGDLVCYRISPHDAIFNDCCSIDRCVRLPRCGILDDFRTEGGVTARFVDGGLLIENFPSSSSEGGGIVIKTEGGFDFDAEWGALKSADLPLGAFLRKVFMAPVDGGEAVPVAVLETINGPEGVELAGRFPALGAEQQTIELYRHGIQVDRIENVSVEENLRPIYNGIPSFETDVRYRQLGILADGIPEAVPPSQSSGSSCDPMERMPGDRPCLFAGNTFKELFPVSFAFSAALADEVRFIQEDVEQVVGPLEEVRLIGGGLQSLLLETVTLDFDCNDNGIPDFDDIDLGISLDLNGDGQPDECKIEETETLVLNTGFDAASQSLLPGGAPDDDWSVSNLGVSARVVRRPHRLWIDPLPDSSWISVKAARGASVPGTRFLDFESCFCLESGDRGVRLNAALFADDRATVLLNGELIAGPGGRFTGPSPLEVEADGLVGDGLFLEGENCLLIRVDDSGGVVTGLNLVGTVESENGFCP